MKLIFHVLEKDDQRTWAGIAALAGDLFAQRVTKWLSPLVRTLPESGRDNISVSGGDDLWLL